MSEPSPKPAVETPCIKVCVLDAGGRLCVGCGRTGNEIAGWLSMSAEQRRRVMAELPARLAAMQAERDGGVPPLRR